MWITLSYGQYYTTTIVSYHQAVRIAQMEARTHNAKRYVVPVMNGYMVFREKPAPADDNVTTIHENGGFSVPLALHHEYPI